MDNIILWIKNAINQINFVIKYKYTNIKSSTKYSLNETFKTFAISVLVWFS